MTDSPDIQKRTQQALWSTRLCAALFGTALIAWGIAPAVVFKLTSGDTPPLALLTIGVVYLVLGVSFLLLASLVRPSRGWALWLALTLSSLLLLATLVTELIEGPDASVLFPLLLSLATACASWMALDGLRRIRAADGAPVAD